MKKKVLSMLVTFAMLLSMLPATALAADFNVTADGNDLDGANSADFYTFDEVLSQATAGAPIIIKEDVTADEAFTVTDVTIDLGGNKLTVGAGGNYFKGNVVVKNGTIDITDVTASGDCIMGIGDRNADATLTLEDVNLTGSGYSSAFAVLMVYGDGTLNVKGGEWNLSDDQSTAGGVIKNESGAGDSGNVNITGTTMQFADVERGIAGATVVLDDVDLTITGGDNGINGSKLTVKDSDITITGGAGRALTVTDYDVSVESSTLNLSGNGEADIRFKSSNTLTVDADSTLGECTVIADSAATDAKVNGSVVTGTESAPQSVAVTGGVTLIKAAPKGTVTPAYTEETKFWGEGTANATASFVVELYEGSTKIATSSLINKDDIIDGDVYVTWSIPFDGVDSDYWDVEWASGYPKYDMNPDAVKLVVDGTAVATNNVYFNAPDNLNKIVALAEGNTGGVKAYTTLADAMGNFNGRKVNVLRDVTESIEVMNGCTLTTNVIGGVTITSTYDNYVYANDLNIGNGVTVKAGNFFYETDGVNAVEGTLEVEEVFYHGYDAKTTVQNGGSIKVSGTTILRYNENEASGLYIYGDDDESTVEFDCDYYIGAYSGTFYAEDANVECGYFLLKPSYDTEKEDADTKYPPMDVTLDNSTITVTGTTDGQNSFQIDDQAILTLQNGSAIKGVRDFNILTGAQPSISVDGTSSVSATNVSIADGVAMEATKNSDGTVTFAKKLIGEGTESNPYVISTLEELKNFRDNVNNGNNYSNKYVELKANIDLAGEAWTPIGTTESPFNGNFNGNNNTISNLVVNGGSSNDQGFFGRTNNGTIKNLTIENAKVSGYLNVGVVVGTPYTSKYTNIKVTGHVEVNGMAYVGGVGGKNAYADWTNITVDADDTSYVKATSTENGKAYRTYVGGVIGFIGEGNHTFKDIKSNIDVIGDVCDIGGIAGIAHYGNNFENIKCTGDVTNNNNTADAAEDVLETGRIAGVWHNAANTEVSFKNIKATGTISAPNVPDVEFPNDGLIGAAYTKTNNTQGTSGSLIIDDKKVWPLIAEVNGVQYGTLSEAIAAAGSEDVVTLLSDAAEAVEISDGGTTIDLGSNTLTGSFLIKNGDFEIKNGSVVNANADVSGIEVNNGSLVLTDVDVSSARHALRVDGSASVTVDGGEYKVSASAGKTTHAVNVSGTASVTVKGGTFTGPKGLVNDSGAAVNVQTGSTVVITGGTFTGGKNNTLVNAGTLAVAGGGFDQDPKAYLATGYYSYQSQSNRMYYVNLDDGFDAVAETNGVKHQTLEAAVNAAKDGGTVVILKGGNYSVPTGKNLTITGAVEDVKFDMSQAVNMSGASVTFNNVTFEYGSSNYVGLQHAGTMVYNDCTINGQVFLYGTSETFNDCTFNQSSADAYNVWTYGAQIVNFNDCEFNSAGKSVLVYNEGACATDLTVVKTKFIASAPVEGKAAIEIDTTLMPDGTDIVIDAATTATGFDKGSISGEELWNDKKDQTDLTVTVGEEQVWPIAVAQIGDQKFYSLQDAVNAAVENETVTITLLTDTSEAARIDIGSKKDITIVGQVNGEGEYPAFTGWFKVTGKLTLKDVTLVAPSTAVPGETTSQYTKTVIGLMNTGDVVCENVTFDMSNAVTDSTAITAWWSTGDGANITVTGCTFDCAGQRPIRSDACVTVEGCTFNDPYRYAVQMTSKSSTMAADAEAYVVFNNNTIVDGENGKEYVYGVQLEGGYGCSDLTITGTGNTITADENDGSTLYFVENTDNMGFETIQWKTETAPVLDQSTFAAKIAGTDGDIYLPTLAEAIGIVAADGTVTLVANSTEEIAINKALTIELNGFTAEKVTPADGYAVVKYETKWVFGAADSVVPVTGVTLSGATSVNVGNTITLTATVAPDNATDKTVTWTSSNESVATVADGVVTGVAAGTATITVTTADGGFTADCTVTVSRASSGGGGGGSYNPSYTITAEDTENGSITVSPSRASSGSTVTITVDPDSGYELDELTVLDKNGKEVKLTKKSDSKYTFKMPSGKVTVEATFAEIEAFENPFTDVAEGAYYYDAVLWAAENGITGGTSATTFSPAVTCTRAQTVTFLWRAAGSPDPEGTNMPFTDVASDAYYYDAVLWAVENGITSGTSATTFSPNATVTRAQNVTFLWRWAESSAVEAVNPFTDVAADMYYHDAVLWAADEGITAGTSATTFSPDDPCLRSQIVTFLYRYLVK